MSSVLSHFLHFLSLSLSFSQQINIFSGRPYDYWWRVIRLASRFLEWLSIMENAVCESPTNRHDRTRSIVFTYVYSYTRCVRRIRCTVTVIVHFCRRRRCHYFTGRVRVYLLTRFTQCRNVWREPRQRGRTRCQKTGGRTSRRVAPQSRRTETIYRRPQCIRV